MKQARAFAAAGLILLAPGAGSAQVALAAPGVEAPVLERAVAKGDLLSAADFVVRVVPAGQARDAPRLQDVVGMEAARPLPPGAVVRTSDVLRPQLVRRGEPVTIVFRDGALSITAEGRALGSGAAGDFVRIVSLSTNRTLDGVVEGSGSVRVSAR